MANRPFRSEARLTLFRFPARCAGIFVLSVLAATAVGAQSVPTGVQEYFVLGWERHIWDMMDEVQNFQGGAQFATAMNSVVTATASADNQVIYYDHWEDGLDPELDNFPVVDPLMLQASTLVIGDGDITNGEVCTFNANSPCGTDVLSAGDYVNFNSDQGLASAVCASLPAEPEKCSVPLNPRNPSEIHYDGGDFILTTGGPLSVIHSQYPLTNFIGGSTEILSRQAVEAARSYSVPIGEDLYVANTVTEPFHYVHLNLVAFADTSITVDSPGIGSVSFNLGRGEHWSSQGYVDATAQPTLALQINSGTKVSTTAAISGMVFTGGDGTWATRHYALLPDILHSTDYVTTAPGDDPTAGPTTNGTPQDRPANIYILNPDQLTAIDVDIIDSSGSYTVNIPANSMRSMDDLAPPRDIAPNSTVRMTSDRNFWGVTAYDYNTHVSDWGHSWLAKKFLTNFYTVSFGPGNQVQPPDMSQFSNPVFVAATVDRTRVQFDLENDGVFDLVDLDGDGVGDAAPFPGNTYGVDMLSALKVIDPGDNDLTGTRIFANKPIAVSWGQDTDRAYFSDNSLDTGFTIYPVNQLFLDPALTIDKTADTTVVPLDPADPDDRIVTYTLTVKSYDFGPLTDGKIFDLLPTGVVGTDYITGTTRITYPNLVQDTVEPSATLQPSGRWLLEWPLTSDPPWASGDPPFSYGTDETLTVEYQVRIPALPGGPPRVLLNEARAEATLGGSVFTPTDLYKLVQTDVEISKTVDSSTTVPDGVLTFTITVTNNGSTTENNPFVTDAIPVDTTYCDATIDPINCSDPTGTTPFDSGTFYAAQNAIEWAAPSLTSGQTATLTFQVKVNPTAVAGTLIPNQAGYESDETPYFLSNLVEPVVEGPILAAVKSIVGSPSFVHPYEVVTFDVMVDNSGSAAANNLRIFDPFPVSATYVPGSMLWSRNSGPFVALTDADDGDEGGGAEGILNASNIEFRLATLGVAEDVTLRFRATVNAGTAGQFVFNQALFASDEVPSTDTNAVQVPIVGNATINGHVFLDVNGNMVQDGGEPDIPNVDVEVTSLSRQTYSCAPGATIPDDAYNGTIGSMACCNIVVPTGDFGAAPFITDLNIDMSAIHTYIGDLTIKVVDPIGQILAMLNRPGSTAPDDGSDAPFGDSSNWNTDTITFDDQGGGPLAEIMGSTIGGTQSICAADGICNYVPAPDTAGGLLNLAGYNGLDPRGTWQVCMGDSAGGDVGTFLSSTLSFLTNESTATTQIVTTDANGDYTAVVNSASATLDVDESDPDFPPGAVLTTANDPQTIATIPGGTAVAPDVGYQQPEIIFTKSSDPVNHEVSPGQVITYTLDITNNTLVTQTGIDLDDPLPTGTSYVTGSTSVVGAGISALRVTEYFLGTGTFTGTTHDLTLDQDLEANYFVIVQGSDGDGTSANDRGPDENYAALVEDPFGTGELATSSGSDVIQLERGNSVDSWVGVVTVVECLAECDTGGFELLDVRFVDHAGTGTTGSENITGSWSDINQVMLMGGFNGAGCLTTEAATVNTKTCHARIFPSGGSQINWTRDPNNATLSDATSTVMAVDWGSEWTLQRVRVQGNNGGDGANATAEYNTAGISSVTRADTWVWGTGHTNDQGIGDASEGVLITLGDGVNENASETLVAVGLEYNNKNVDFEVYALTHPDLAADYAFKIDGDGTAATFDVTVAAAGAERMALSYNGQNGTGNAYPRPMFSARYIANTTIRLERRRTGQDFPAWVQGIDFTAITAAGAPPSGGVPPNLVIPADGYTIAPGATMTVTFQVEVDDPLAGGITQIVNNATLMTVEQPGPWFASVTEDVIRAGVVVEYDNAGFDLLGATVTYAHDVRNTGEGDDSYDITLTSQEGWPVDLIDPGTGAVIASDADGDGNWDGGVTINTGTVAPGGIVQYQLRVTIPLAASVGDTESTGLIATSGRNPGLWDIGTDETIAITSLDPIIFLPDNSGVATAGGKAVYAHRVINNTGAPETFDLLAARDLSAPPWTTTYYWDSNGDGVYSDGIDIAITNTAQLAQGASQLVFVVVDVPAGTPDYTVDVVHLTAAAQSDPENQFDTSSDTTTVRPPVVLDLSGGGTRNLIGGATGVFPGTLRNFTDAADVMNLDITQSWFYGFDVYNHPTELWIDTNDDGSPDLEIAEDTDGDGTWDTIAPGYDTDGNSQPDVSVGANSNLAYELRRDVDALQGPARDPVTLTVFSTNSTDQDSITATNFVAAATRAVYASVDAFAVNGQVVVEWRTAAEVGTIGFDVLRRREDEERFSKVNGGLIRSAGAIQGGTYSVIDRDAEVGETLSYLIRERDVWGSGTTSKPTTVTIGERNAGTKASQALARGVSRTANTSSIRSPYATTAAAKSGGTPSGLIKILIREEGMVWLAAEQLAEAFDVSTAEVSSWIGQGALRIGTGGGAVGGDLSMIFQDGFETGNMSMWSSPAKSTEEGGIAWVAAESDSGIYFFGQAIDSIYSRDNVYWLEHANGSVMARRDAWADPPPIVGTFENTIHIENDNWPLTSVISDPEADYWFWDYFFPYDGEPSVSKSFTIAAVAAADTAGEARLRLHLQGSFESQVPQNHRYEVRLNGTQLGGTMTFDGHDAHDVELVFSQSLLQDGDNTVEITALLAPGLDFDEFYLDSIELDYLRRYEARDNRLLAWANGDPQITVGGFSSSDINVFDLSDPQQPVMLDPVHVYSDDGDYLVSFSTGGSALPFLAATTAASVQPEGLVEDLASSLAENGNRGQYVVVAGPGLEAEAGLLADYRAAQGMTTVVARTADIYDEFNGGLKSPWAIRDFLYHAAIHWEEPPEFVLLAGDGSLDHKGVWGDGEDLVPALMAVTADGLVPSDNLLADWVGGDGVPEVAIGRLPAQSAAELAAYRNKIAVFESSGGGWKRHSLWMADDEDVGGLFTDDVDDLISVLGPNFTATRLSLEQYDVVEAWDLALDTMGKGAALVNFLGHGGFDRLTEEGLVVTDKAIAMTNADRTPFLTALTCVVGRFDVPGYDTLSEALLLNSGGGAVAVWSPSAYSMNQDARFLGEKHAAAIAGGGITTIGQSVREALAAYAAEATGDESVPSKFILLGDPATRVDW